MSATCIVLGVVGLLLNVLWPLVRGRGPLLVWQGLACWVFAGHFLLLPQPATTGAWINVIAGSQCFLAVPFARRPNFRWVYLLTLPALGWLLWQGFVGASAAAARGATVAACLAMGLQCVGRFQLDEIRLRGFILAALPFWVAHNALMRSWPALGSDFASVVAGLIGLKLALAERGKREAGARRRD